MYVLYGTKSGSIAYHVYILTPTTSFVQARYMIPFPVCLFVTERLWSIG